MIGGYWYGGWRLRRGRRKVTSDFIVLMSLLLAGYLALKAVNYWLSRYALTTSQLHGPVTGPSYTDVHAGLPSTYVLTVVAIVCALALLANAVSGRPRRCRGIAPARSAGSGCWPARSSSWWSPRPWSVRPCRRWCTSSVRRPVPRHSTSTRSPTTRRPPRAAFDLGQNTGDVPYDPPTTSQSATQQLATTTAQISVLDANQLTPTFNVEQQLQAYYGFKSTLDIGNYDINGQSQDVDLAVRELHVSAIPQSSWVNQHLVYTHGYGIVAAPTDQVDPATSSPVFLNGGIPPSQEIPVSRPQVYFGPGVRLVVVCDRGPTRRQPHRAGVRPSGWQGFVEVGLHGLPR